MSKFDLSSPDPCGIIGKTFGKLTAIEYLGHIRDRNEKWQYMYRVKCGCRAETIFEVPYNSLASGNTTSCPRCKHGDPVIVGDQFGSLTVIEIIPPDPEHKFTRTVCECDCPDHPRLIVPVQYLRQKKTTSCGSTYHRIRKEYTGRLQLGMQPNSEIEVLEISETKRTTKGERVAICKCHHVNPISEKKCGKIFEAAVTNILTGNTRTCGCAHMLYPDEESAALGKKWFSMRYRCNRDTCKSYPDYGGRGIKVTKDWDETKEGRVQFIKDVNKEGIFEMGQSIDRIGNDDSYELKNIRFVGPVVQNNNKRNNHYITVNGVKMSIGNWAHTLKVNRVMLENKMRAVTDESEYIRRLIHHETEITDRIPYDLCVKRKERCDKGNCRSDLKFTINGVTKFDYEWEQEYHVPRRFIKRHREHGFTDEQTIHALERWKEEGGNPHESRSDHLITACGTTLSITKWATELGIDRVKMYAALRHKTEPEKAKYIEEKLKERS